MTFPDPVGWPDTPARPHDDTSAARSGPSDASFDLPPLPTLSPLPMVKPLAPMPRPPWETDVPAMSGDVAATRAPGGNPGPPPPPSGHPAAEPAGPGWAAPASWPTIAAPSPAPAHDPWSAAASAPAPAAPAASGTPSPAPASEPWMTQPASADTPVVSRPAPAPPESAAPTPEIPSWTPTPVPAPVPAPAASFTTAAPQPVTGRHAGADVSTRSDMLPLAPGLRVFMVGGSEPLGNMIAERLILAGHRLAVHGVTLPTDLQQNIENPTFRLAEPLSLPGDRADAEEIVHSVARAEVTLGGLDAVVVLPAQQAAGTTLDADAATWADDWSLALTTEVLAAACATHIAARSFLARRRAGRIILVTNGRDGSVSGTMPTSATRAALSRLGADLTRELSPHGIGVSVVTTGPGGAQDFAMTQVADVVEALLSTPVLSGLGARIG